VNKKFTYSPDKSLNKSQIKENLKAQKISNKNEMNLNDMNQEYLINEKNARYKNSSKMIFEGGSTGNGSLIKSVSQKKLELSYNDNIGGFSVNKIASQNLRSENNLNKESITPTNLNMQTKKSTQDLFLTNLLGESSNNSNSNFKVNTKISDLNVIENIGPKKNESRRDILVPVINNVKSEDISAKETPLISLQEENKKTYKKRLSKGYTLKNRNTVLNHIHKIKSKHKKTPNRSKGKKDSLDVSSDDEMFDNLPELELRNNLLDGRFLDKNGNYKLNENDLVNILKSPKNPPPKRKKLFDKIYKIDDQFLDIMDKTRKNKDKYPLMDYQNRIFGLLTVRMSKENLKKLSIQFKDVRELSDRVQAMTPVDWQEVSRRIEEILLGKNATGTLNISKAHEYNSSLLSKKTNLANLKKMPVITSVEEESPRKLNTMSNVDNKLELPEIKKEYVSKKKVNDNIKSRSSFLPSFLVEKFNKVFKIKN
jgi:hypothetical protein